MLYDILIIDDDFNLKNRKERKKWDSSKPYPEAGNLLYTLSSQHLRVYATTGDDKGLEKLGVIELSTVRFIYLDLSFTQPSSMAIDVNFEEMVDGIESIFGQITEHISSPSVKVRINSKLPPSEQDECVKQLEEAFKQDDKYSKFEILPRDDASLRKNELTPDEIADLQQHHIQTQMKPLIINAAIEIEGSFEDRLCFGNIPREVIDLSSKFKVFESIFVVDSPDKSQFRLLRELRNKLAHTTPVSSRLEGLDSDYRKTFYEILNGKKKPEKGYPDVEFKSFKDLAKYLESVAKLKEAFKKAPQITSPTK